MNKRNTVTIIAEEIGKAFLPLSDILASRESFSGLLLELGWDYLDTIPTPILDLGEHVAAISNAIGDGEVGLDDLDTLTGAIRGLMNAVAALKTEAGIPIELSNAGFKTEFPVRLIDYLLIEYLEENQEIAHAVLSVFGVIREQYVEESINRPGYTKREIAWSAFTQLLSDPRGMMEEAFGWATADFDQETLLDHLLELGNSLGLSLELRQLDEALVTVLEEGSTETEPKFPWSVHFPVYFDNSGATPIEVGFLIYPLPPKETASGEEILPGISFLPYASGDFSEPFELSENLTLTIGSDFDLSAGVALLLRPGQGVELLTDILPSVDSGASPTASDCLDLALEYSGTADEPIMLLGSLEGSRLQVEGISLGGGVYAYSSGRLEAYLEFELKGSKLVVTTAEGDGFVQKLFENVTLEAEFDLRLGISTEKGIYFRGGTALEVSIPTHLNLGLLSVDAITIALKPDGTELPVELGASITTELGPLILIVENIGLKADFAFPGSGGNLGPLDLSLGFKPPDGIGLAIDAGPVSGGGILYIDRDAGEYAGVLALETLTVGISAFGIINTKLPGGGWSLFFALYIEVPSIPLGFGFTLNGVGGVAGINRTIDVEGLKSAIRSGSLDRVLFPEDPILDAPIIIDAVQAIFPSAEGRYVFGPVVQIGWGTPTLIEAEIGIVIELPDPIKIAVLGSVTSVLPTRDIDLVALHLEVAGIIDTGAGTLSIDSSLHGSHIVGFPLSGDMALRSAFGDAPSFLMALGGNHPGFDRPDKFPEIDRLTLGINAGDLIDIRFDCYFAVASNSVQFGAAFEMTAEVEGFGINGGASFDALIDFSPFSLQTDLGYHISVKAAGVDLLAVWLDVKLSGPNPWHVVGTATFTILGIDNTIKLDQKIGSKEREEPPESEDVLDQVWAAVALPEAWSVGAGGGRGVVFAADDPLSDDLAVTPDGTLGVSQRVVPLGITIDKSEPWQIEGGYNRFDLESDEQLGMASTGSLTDWFVVSSYKDLGPREQLSAPSFDRLKSGIEFGGGGPTAGDARMGTLEYEQILRDPELDDATVKLSPFNLRADPRTAGLADMATGLVTTGYTVATDDPPPTVVSAGYAAIDELTGAVLGRKPNWTASRLSTAGRKAGVTVVPAWEVAE